MADSYREPGVKVTITEEGYAVPAPDVDLPPIFYGPVFQIVTKGTLGSYSNDSGLMASYPDQVSGSTVDTNSVEVFIIHDDTGHEYDITDGDDGGSTPTIDSSSVDIPSGLYFEQVDSDTGVREAGENGLVLSDAGADLTGARYGDKIVFTDNDDEIHTINECNSDGDIEIVTKYAKYFLFYDGGTIDFEVGDIVVGDNSGATAEVVGVRGTTASGYLLLGAITPAGAHFEGDAFVGAEGLEVGGVKYADVAHGNANKAEIEIGTDKVLHFNLTGAIAEDDTLDGATSGAQGIVLYEEDDGTYGYVYLEMVAAGFEDGESLEVGGGAEGTADGTERDLSGQVEEIGAESILYYDNLSQSFTVGETVTGGVSGASAPILDVYESGTTGYLILGTVTGGPFQDDEAITDGAVPAGTADANGVEAQAENAQILYFDTLTGTIAIGDLLEGATSGAQGVVLYEEDDTEDGFVLLEMGDPLTAFQDGENLEVGGIVQAVADGASGDLSISVNRSYEIRRYLEGTAYVTYKAARSDREKELVWISDMDELIEYTGTEEQIVPDNPLPYACYLSLSVGSGAYLVMVDDLDGYLDSDDADLTKWTEAFEAAKESSLAYGHVPLVQDDNVRSLMEVFINWMRDPDNYMSECVGYFCPARTTEEVAITQREADGGASDAHTWKDNNISSFVAYGCEVGRTLELIDVDGVAGDEGEVYKFTAANVTADEIQTVEAMSVDQQSIITYRFVNDYFDLDEEALYYQIYGEAIQNKAIRLIFPSLAQFDDEEVPGYYLAAIRAAQLNINRPQHIYTKEAAPLVERVIGPDFDRDQFNEVAAGGWMIFYQENVNAPVYCRDAITTDRSLPAREEEVVVTEIDYAARYIRAVFLPEQGRHHLDEMLADGIATLAGGCQSHLVDEYKCLASLELLKYEQDEDEPRKINYEFAAGPRWPNKWADIVIRVLGS